MAKKSKPQRKLGKLKRFERAEMDNAPVTLYYTLLLRRKEEDRADQPEDPSRWWSDRFGTNTPPPKPTEVIREFCDAIAICDYRGAACPEQCPHLIVAGMVASDTYLSEGGFTPRRVWLPTPLVHLIEELARSEGRPTEDTLVTLLEESVSRLGVACTTERGVEAIYRAKEGGK